jgi:hypothetical protein
MRSSKMASGLCSIASAKPCSGSLPRHAGNLVVINRKTDSGEKLGGSESILLVEDAEPLWRLAQTFLDAAGYRVLTAHRFRSASGMPLADRRAEGSYSPK